MNPTRMEAQLIRDSLLYLAGDLDLALGGPSIPVANEASRRRSLYFVHSNNDQHKFLAMFDDAKVQECYRRAESVVPQQALALENSKLATGAAERIASQLATQFSSLDDRLIRATFQSVLCIAPTEQELAACREALTAWRAELQAKHSDKVEAIMRTYLVQSLLNHNDFVTVR
jgi:hypothetical protein